MTLAPRSGFGVSDQSCRGAWMGSSRAAVPMSTAPKPRGKIHVILGCRFASLRDGVKKRLSDHVPETGAPKNGRGREVHAWQTLTGEVARLPCGNENGRRKRRPFLCTLPLGERC